MNKYARALQKIEEGATSGLGVPVGELVSRGLVVRRSSTSRKYVAPDGAPRWAIRYRSSRKKYGVEERVMNNTSLKLTERGSKLLSGQKRKNKEINDEL